MAERSDLRCNTSPCERWADHPGPHAAIDDTFGTWGHWWPEVPCPNCGQNLIPGGDYLHRYKWKHEFGGEATCPYVPKLDDDD